MSRTSTFVLLAASIALAVCGCGELGDRTEADRKGYAEPKNADVVPPFRQLISFWATRSDEHRLTEVLTFAMGQPINAEQKHGRTFIEFAEMLIELGELDALLYVEKQLQSSDASDASEKVELLHAALYNQSHNEHVHRTALLKALKALAPHRPASFLLAPWRNDGMLELLNLVKDESRDVSDRVRAAWMLGTHGTMELVPELEKLRNDATPHSTNIPYSDPRSLGEFVERAIARIKERT